MSTVGIVGAGLIGRAWANVFARAGWDVRLWDPDAKALKAAPGLIEEALADVAKPIACEASFPVNRRPSI